jgi:hypothetical protein
VLATSAWQVINSFATRGFQFDAIPFVNSYAYFLAIAVLFKTVLAMPISLCVFPMFSCNGVSVSGSPSLLSYSFSGFGGFQYALFTHVYKVIL